MTQDKDHQTLNYLMNSDPDWKKQATMEDESIDLSDIDELDDDFFLHAEVRIPPNKN